MMIPFVQFLRPDVRQVVAHVKIPDNLADQWEKIVACGARLTAEVLTTGEVSLTIEHPVDGDFDIRVVPNGPRVAEATQELITAFCLIAFEAWRRDLHA